MIETDRNRLYRLQCILCGKSARNINSTSTLGNLTRCKVKIDIRMARQGVLFAEARTTFAIVDQLPAFNNRVSHSPFKANHV